jgi:hypothetical protein
MQDEKICKAGSRFYESAFVIDEVASEAARKRMR